MNIRMLYFFRLLTRWLPDTPKLNPLKCALLRFCGVEVGKGVSLASDIEIIGWGRLVLHNGVRISRGVYISCNGKIELGENVEILENNLLVAEGEISIGDNSKVFQSSLFAANGDSILRIGRHCQIAHMVSIKTSHHQIDSSGVSIAGKSLFDSITIHDGCWICAGAVIIPGVTIGKRSVVAAGAVVTRDVPSQSLVAGVPAEVKKRYI